MKSKFAALLMRWLVLALGVTLATKIVDGITCDDGQTLLIVVVLLSFFNAVVRPILVLFTLPFILLTMGVGLVVINALLFMLVGHLVDGFHVASFWSAFWGALIVGVTNIIMAAFMRKPPDNGGKGGGGNGGGGTGINVNVSGRIGRKRESGGDVIDV
ncbi:membrane protein [Verrucomicrobia bacterium IMCC26134]|jgi:putative membrane protein|nr:membrane protein [Verrucomicrobia bacterium IMCC26134]